VGDGDTGNGSADEDGADELEIELGTNANGKLTSGWPVTVNESVNGNMEISGGDVIALTVANTSVTGPLSITGGNAWTLNVSNTTVGGALDITLGSGGVNNLETINLNMVTANDIHIMVTSAATDVPDTVPAGVNISLSNVNVLDTTPNPDNLSIIDNGLGVDIVTLMNVNVVYGMLIDLAGYLNQTGALGANVLTAENVTTAFGMADGGGVAGEAGSVYQDLGGNFGFVVMNFVGH
jgi:hypothetical protein